MCHFYPSRRDLVDNLVPYFAAGLRNDELCVWVTADPLPVDEAKGELSRVVPDVDKAVREGRLKILEAGGWYETALRMSPGDMVALWLEQEQKALARGFRGLRVTGNTSFLTPPTWDAFMDYEHVLSRAFYGRRVVAICSYHRQHCGAGEMTDVLHHHHCALERSDAFWQVSEAPYPLTTIPRA